MAQKSNTLLHLNFTLQLHLITTKDGGNQNVQRFSGQNYFGLRTSEMDLLVIFWSRIFATDSPQQFRNERDKDKNEEGINIRFVAIQYSHCTRPIIYIAMVHIRCNIMQY